MDFNRDRRRPSPSDPGRRHERDPRGSDTYTPTSPKKRKRSPASDHHSRHDSNRRDSTISNRDSRRSPPSRQRSPRSGRDRSPDRPVRRDYHDRDHQADRERARSPKRASNRSKSPAKRPSVDMTDAPSRRASEASLPDAVRLPKVIDPSRPVLSTTMMTTTKPARQTEMESPSMLTPSTPSEQPAAIPASRDTPATPLQEYLYSLHYSSKDPILQAQLDTAHGVLARRKEDLRQLRKPGMNFPGALKKQEEAVDKAQKSVEDLQLKLNTEKQKGKRWAEAFVNRVIAGQGQSADSIPSSAIEKRLAALEAKNAELETKHSKSDEKITDLERRNGELEVKLKSHEDHLANELRGLSARLDALSKNMNVIDTRSAALKKIFDDRKIAEIPSQVANISSQFQAVSKTAAGLKKELDESKLAMQGQIRSVQQSQVTKESAEKMLTQPTMRIDSIENGLAALGRRVDDISAPVKSVDTTIIKNEFQQQLDALSRKITQQPATHNSNTASSNLSGDFTSLTEKVKVLEEGQLDAVSRIEELKGQLERAEIAQRKVEQAWGEEVESLDNTVTCHTKTLEQLQRDLEVVKEATNKQAADAQELRDATKERVSQQERLESQLQALKNRPEAPVARAEANAAYDPDSRFEHLEAQINSLQMGVHGIDIRMNNMTTEPVVNAMMRSLETFFPYLREATANASNIRTIMQNVNSLDQRSQKETNALEEKAASLEQALEEIRGNFLKAVTGLQEEDGRAFEAILRLEVELEKVRSDGIRITSNGRSSPGGIISRLRNARQSSTHATPPVNGDGDGDGNGNGTSNDRGAGVYMPENGDRDELSSPERMSHSDGELQDELSRQAANATAPYPLGGERL